MMFKGIILLCLIGVFFAAGCKNDDSSVTPPAVSNHPPAVPNNPVPKDSATNVSRFVTLTWQCSDPDAGDTVRYDVFWGTNGNTGNVGITNSLQTSLDLGLVASQVTLYWRVVAKDNNGAYSNGPIWRFTTGN